MSVPVLAASGLCREFPGGVHAVADVSFELQPAEIVAITGPSGSGKSTLLSLLAGLLRPTAGEVWVNGTALSGLSEGERARLRRRELGFVFQSFNLVPVLSIAENVGLPQLLDGASEREIRPRVAEALAAVGLSHRAAHLPGAASVGEQQRAAIARALAGQPRVLLADEPTGSLDRERGAAILDLLELSRRTRGMSVILVTHDLEAAARADRQLQMRDGRLCAPGGRSD